MFWVNGAYQEAAQTLDIADRGFLLGDGVFETILVRNRVGAFLDQHLARLRAGLDALEIPVPQFPDVENIIARLANENALDGDGVARLTISRGASGRGLAFASVSKTSPTMLLTVQSGIPQINAPISLKVSPHCRAEKSISARHKTLNYLDNILARNDAMASGLDDAVMLNGNGRLACASAANIFTIDQNGMISTPPLTEGALPGIVRGIILQAPTQTDLVVRELPLEAEILERDFVFLSNSLMGLRQAILAGNGNGQSGSIAGETFQRLQTWYENRLGEDITGRAGVS